MARKPISAGPAASGRIRLAMIRSSWRHHELGVHADADAQFHGVRIRDHAHEGPRHLVVRPVRGLELQVVLGERLRALAAQRMPEGGGGQATGLVAVGDALAVERVDGAGGVAGQDHVGAGSGPDREAHGELAAGRRTETGLGAQAPRRRGLVDERVHQVGGVDPLPAAIGGKEADTDVDPAVAHGEDPAVAGHDVALGVTDVQMGLDERIVVPLGGVVAAQRHAQRQVTATMVPEHAADPRVGAVGHDDVAGADLAGGADSLSLTVTPRSWGAGREGGAASSTSGATTSVPAEGCPRLDGPLRDEAVEVVAGDRVAVAGEIGVPGPLHLDGLAEAVGPQPAVFVRARQGVFESHVGQLAHGPGGEAVAAGLLAGKCFFSTTATFQPASANQ